jgi:type IV secretory pathway VirB9-like protein
MKSLTVLFLFGVFAIFVSAQPQNQAGSLDSLDVTHVHTALGHVSLLEFKEPVTAAAAGSKIFHIERLENKVLITPLKAGVSTNLFVWTSTRRFSYELDAPGDVDSTTLAIDAPAPEIKPTVDLKQQQVQMLTEMLLNKTLLDAQVIDSSSAKPAKGAISIRVERVFRTSDTAYIYFTVDNQSKQPLRTTQPSVNRVEAEQSSISLWGLVNHQLTSGLMAHLGTTKASPVTVAYSAFEGRDLSPGTQKAGVVAIQLARSSPTILQLMIADGVKAAFVL